MRVAPQINLLRSMLLLEQLTLHSVERGPRGNPPLEGYFSLGKYSMNRALPHRAARSLFNTLKRHPWVSLTATHKVVHTPVFGFGFCHCGLGALIVGLRRSIDYNHETPLRLLTLRQRVHQGITSLSIHLIFKAFDSKYRGTRSYIQLLEVIVVNPKILQ